MTNNLIIRLIHDFCGNVRGRGLSETRQAMFARFCCWLRLAQVGEGVPSDPSADLKVPQVRGQILMALAKSASPH